MVHNLKKISNSIQRSVFPITVMASETYISDYISVFHKIIYNSQQEEKEEEEPAAVSGEPHLVLYFAYYIDGDFITLRNKSRHRFADCLSPSSLQAFIMELEGIPLENMVFPEDAEPARERISEVIASLVRGCVGHAGLQMIEVAIVVDVSEGEEDLISLDDDEAEFVAERRMGRVREEILEGKGGGFGDASVSAGGEGGSIGEEKEKEMCAVCMEEMEVGEVVARTPCMHQFHGGCIRRWFGKAGLCPLCRFVMDQ